jgi:hypothetical protein
MDGTHSRAGAAAQIGSHEVHAVHRLSEGIVRCVPRVHPPRDARSIMPRFGGLRCQRGTMLRRTTRRHWLAKTQRRNGPGYDWTKGDGIGRKEME